MYILVVNLCHVLAVRCEVNSGPVSQCTDRQHLKNISNIGEGQAEVFKCHFLPDSHMYHIQIKDRILQHYCNNNAAAQ